MKSNFLRNILQSPVLTEYPKKSPLDRINQCMTVSDSQENIVQAETMNETTTGSKNPAYKDDEPVIIEVNSNHPKPGIPVISIDIEEDPVFPPELQAELDKKDDSGNTDFLSVPDHGHKRSSSRSSSRLSSASSRLSSTISVISLASSNISSRVDFEATRSLCMRSLGLLLAFMSGVLMTAYSSMIKMLDEMDSLQVVVMRGALQIAVMLVVAMYKNLSFCGDKKRMTLIFLFLVAVTGGLRLVFIFSSFSRLPLGDSTTIIFSSPVLVMLFSICILKEPCGLFRICAGASLLTGVVLIAKPPFIFGSADTTYDFIGYTMVCLACFMSALGIVLTKKISKKVEKTVILLYMGIAYVICGCAGLFSVGTPSNPALWEWGLASAISVLGVIQQYCLIYAVTLESPARVTIIRQLQIVLAYVVQIFMFDVMPMWTDVMGAGLVLITVITITFEKKIVNMRIFRCFNRNSDKTVKEEKEKTEHNVDTDIEKEKECITEKPEKI